ncbi:MAG: hypothetical protein Q9183_002547 [Haloplaca sp. 2 TL-2023]
MESSRQLHDSEVQGLQGTTPDEFTEVSTEHEELDPQSHAEANENGETTATNTLEHEPATAPLSTPARTLVDRRPQGQVSSAADHLEDVHLAIDVEGYDLTEIVRKDKERYMDIKPPFALWSDKGNPMQVAAVLLDRHGKCTQEKLEISMRKWNAIYMYRTLRIRGCECIVVMSGGGKSSPKQPSWLSYTFRVWFGHEQGLSEMPVARRVCWTISQVVAILELKYFPELDELARLVSPPPILTQRLASPLGMPKKNDGNGNDVNEYDLRGKGKTPRCQMKRGASTKSRPLVRTKRPRRETKEDAPDTTLPSKKSRRNQVV